jgi:hypothetical protein
MTGLCVGAEILQVEVPAGAVEHHSRVAAARADLKTSCVRHDLGDQGTQLLLLGEVSRCPAYVAPVRAAPTRPDLIAVRALNWAYAIRPVSQRFSPHVSPGGPR